MTEVTGGMAVERCPIVMRRAVDQLVSTSHIAVLLYDFSTSRVAYSGGRYHALLLGHALAERGCRVTFICDRKPVVETELSAIYRAPIEMLELGDFRRTPKTLELSHLVVAPTGAHKPSFYAFALNLLAQSGATPILLNYETANWFDELYVNDDDRSIWNNWRRVVTHGGVVLSTTAEASRYAQSFYRSHGPLTFDQSYAPLNSLTAASVRKRMIERQPDVLTYFARPYHPHKGGEDIVDLPLGVLRNMKLQVVFGSAPELRFVERLRRAVEGSGGELSIRSRVSELEKFEILARSTALLFPSHFEGFGYPPLEAALVGTPTVCYDLPVLRETLGTLAFFAPVGDVGRFGEQILRATTANPDRSTLSTHADRLAGFDAISRHLISRFSTWSTPVVPKVPIPVEWGPPEGREPVRAGLSSPSTPNAAPPYLAAVEMRTDELQLVIVMEIPVGAIPTLEVFGEPVDVAVLEESPLSDGMLQVRVAARLRRRDASGRFYLGYDDRDGRKLVLDEFVLPSYVGPSTTKVDKT